MESFSMDIGIRVFPSELTVSRQPENIIWKGPCNFERCTKDFVLV